jgi:hypothetical protein
VKKHPDGAVELKLNLIPFSVLRAGCKSYFLILSSLKGSPLSIDVISPASKALYLKEGKNAVFLLILVNFIALASFSSYLRISRCALLLALIIVI